TRDWSPSKAVSSPSNSITMAMPPITSPQNITISFGGSCRPRVVRIPMTTEAETAAVMKKIAKLTMISNGKHSAYGRVPTRVNSTCGAAISSVNPGLPSRYIQIEDAPITPYTTNSSDDGLSITPKINWRMVLPREMREMKIQTTGYYEIHQSQ